MPNVNARSSEDGAEHLFQFIADIEDHYLASVFFLTLFAYTGILVVKAFSYLPSARLFPLLVGVPLLGLIVVQVGLLLAGERIPFERNNLFSNPEGSSIDESESAQPAARRYRREFEMIGWVAAAVGIIWLFGHLVGLGVFVFTFVYRFERNLMKAVFITLVALLFVYLLFFLLLDANLWKGLDSIWGGL